MKKICFLQYDLCGGGAERKVCTLANFLASKGYEVSIGLFGRDEVAYKLDNRIKKTFINRGSYNYKNNNEKLIYYITLLFQYIYYFLPALIIEHLSKLFRLKLHHKINSIRVKKHFDKINNYEKPIIRYLEDHSDCIFITMMAVHFLEIIRLSQKNNNLLKICTHYIVMDCNNPKFNATGELDTLRTKYYEQIAQCIVMTEGAKVYFNQKIQEHCIVIPNPIRNDLPEAYTGKRRKVITNYCRLNKQKNLPLLFEAFEMFVKDHDDYLLEIYGQGELKQELLILIDQMGLQEKIVLYPFTPQVHEKIKDCRMFVSSSNFEGYPNTVLESLALGLPVISTDCDFGPRDMITDHYNGILTPVGDVNALYLAMKELAESDELVEKLSRNAIKIRETNSAERIGEQWIKLIEDVERDWKK